MIQNRFSNSNFVARKKGSAVAAACSRKLSERRSQIDAGWWKVREAYIANTYKEEVDAARAQARRDLDQENVVLSGKIRELRRQQGSGEAAQRLLQKIILC